MDEKIEVSASFLAKQSLELAEARAKIAETPTAPAQGEVAELRRTNK